MHPNFVSSIGLVTIIYSVVHNNDVGVGMASGLLTLGDMHVLGKKNEHIAVEDMIALTVQCAAFVANLGQLLVAKNQQVQELTM